jgi:hypothetical protein
VGTVDGSQLFIAPTFSAKLTPAPEDDHLDSTAYPNDLMNATLPPGVRRLPSPIDVQILDIVRNGTYLPLLNGTFVNAAGQQLDPVGAMFALWAGSSAIVNGTFAVTDQTSPAFGWTAKGNVAVNAGTATLTENPNVFSGLLQTFTIPTGATALRFTVYPSFVANSFGPPDAFEAALLNPMTGASLLSAPTGLTMTDAFLNVQTSGRTFFSAETQVTGVPASGQTATAGSPLVVTVSLAGLTAGTQATLDLDLLGFGPPGSAVQIANVQLLGPDGNHAPVAANDTYATPEGQQLVVSAAAGVLHNDTDAENDPLTAQLVSQPANGGVVLNADGSFTYTPATNFTGTDSFTYQASDGQSLSNVATVSVDVTGTSGLVDASASVVSSSISSTYGQSVFFTATVKAVTGTATPTGLVTFYDGNTVVDTETLNAQGRATSVAMATLTAVDHNITVSYAGDSNFNGTTSPAIDQSVAKAHLSVQADNQSMVYGGTLPTLTAIISGFQNAQTLATSGVTGAPALATVAATSHAGQYAITATLGSLATANYDFPAANFVNGTLTITPANLTISADNQTMPYGGPLPKLTGSYSGFVNGDTSASLTAAPLLTTTATAASHVSGNPYSITVGRAVDTDYTISYVPGTLTVTPVSLTISADSETMPYGGPLPKLTAGYSGFVNGDTGASLTTAPLLTTTANISSHVSGNPYRITVSRAVDTDYTISYVPGTLTVTPASLTISAESKSMPYGGPLPKLTAGYSGFVNGDTSASLTALPNVSTTATARSHVADSPYAINAAGAADSDYRISYLPGQLTVTAAPLTITADEKTKLFGDPLPNLTAKFVGFVNGDNPASLSTRPVLTTTANAYSPAGSYAIKPGGAVDPDYAISYVAGKLTVTVAASIYLLGPTGVDLQISQTTGMRGRDLGVGNGGHGSGGASIQVAGTVMVDSNSRSAVNDDASFSLSAASIRVVGGINKAKDTVLYPNPVTGAEPFPDPFAGLTAPEGGIYRGTIAKDHGSLTINPGIYSTIDVSGTASLILNPGIYILAGGGFNVTGNASVKVNHNGRPDLVTGMGVLIYNADNSYLTGDGSKPAHPVPRGRAYGAINLNSGGSINLTPPSIGPYAGIVIFQARDNKNDLYLGGQVNLSGGVLYAPAAAVTLSDRARLHAALVVYRLRLNGSASVSDRTTAAQGSKPDYAARDLAFAGLGQTSAMPSGSGGQPFGHDSAVGYDYAGNDEEAALIALGKKKRRGLK